MNQLRRCLQFGFFLPLLLILSGCGNGGGPVGYVSGKVTLPDGKSPAGLLVRFVDGSTGVGATSVVAEDGTYTLKHKGASGVPVGSFKVSVTAYIPHMSDREYSSFMAASPEERKRIEDEQNAEKGRVPKKFHNQNTSGLTYEIVSGSQSHDVVVTK